MPKANADPAQQFVVEWWPIERLIPYARNARKIKQDDIVKMSSILKEYGWQQCVLAEPETDVIIAGHLRRAAAQFLLEGGDERFKIAPVKVAHGLTKAQMKAFRLGDNRIGAQVKNDYELLAGELQELRDEFGFDLSLTGFEQHEIDPLLAADWSTDEIKDEPEEQEPEKAPDMFSIKLTAEQHEIVGRAIMALRHEEAEMKISDGRALELICADYLSGTKYAPLDGVEEAND